MKNLNEIPYNRADAIAIIRGSDAYPDIDGIISFYKVNVGVMVFAKITGLPKDGALCHSPIYAFHIHSGEKCSGDETDPFKDANGHYNPLNCEHPYHAGDMPPLFNANGIAISAFLTNRFKIDEIIGKAVIIHSQPDDFKTQPSGNSGEKIACGIITK